MVNPNRFYTYAYLREDRTPYYIGKGCKNRIDDDRGKPCKKPKDKSRIIFLKQNLTEEGAFKHEKYMIGVFGRKDLGTGILRNKSDGGDGASGAVRSEEYKRKMSEAKLGKKKRPYSEEYKKQMSERMRGRECPSSRRKHSEEEKEKRRQKMLGRKWWNDGETETCSHECPGNEWVSGRINKSLSCLWELISPGGVVYITNNLASFCKDRFDKSTSVLANVAYGIRNHYRGWKCRKITKYEYA
jgi:hypothetical protein